MTNLIGQVEAFQPGIDDWEQYTERLEQYFVANKVVDEAQQLAVSITVVGSKTYALLSDLLVPVKPADKSYKELKDVLKAHLKPKPLIIAERFQFHQRSQQTGEDVASYMAALRRLADKCSYGAHLEEALRDRFVCGLQGAAIQRKLLAIDGLTLKTTYKQPTAWRLQTVEPASCSCKGLGQRRQLMPQSMWLITMVPPATGAVRLTTLRSVSTANKSVEPVASQVILQRCAEARKAPVLAQDQLPAQGQDTVLTL